MKSDGDRPKPSLLGALTVLAPVRVSDGWALLRALPAAVQVLAICATILPVSAALAFILRNFREFFGGLWTELFAFLSQYFSIQVPFESRQLDALTLLGLSIAALLAGLWAKQREGIVFLLREVSRRINFPASDLLEGRNALEQVLSMIMFNVLLLIWTACLVYALAPTVALYVVFSHASPDAFAQHLREFVRDDAGKVWLADYNNWADDVVRHQYAIGNFNVSIYNALAALLAVFVPFIIFGLFSRDWFGELIVWVREQTIVVKLPLFLMISIIYLFLLAFMLLVVVPAALEFTFAVVYYALRVGIFAFGGPTETWHYWWFAGLYIGIFATILGALFVDWRMFFRIVLLAAIVLAVDSTFRAAFDLYVKLGGPMIKFGG